MQTFFYLLDMTLRLLVFLCILFPAFAKAIEVLDLYESTLYIDDKTRASRVEASKAALTNVIKKLTGKSEANSHPLIRQAMRSISDYMLKYEYLETREGDLQIKVKFEAQKVEELVRDSNLPLWGNRRPKIAIWLAIEDGFRRDFVTQESYPQLERLIYDTAQDWGVPIVVPLMDLEDRSKVGIAEVWGNFSEPVEIASMRYQAERVITARMFKPEASDFWQLEWRYTDAELFESNQLVGDKQQVLIQMVNNFSDALVKQFAIDPNKTYASASSVLTVDKLTDFVTIEQARRQLISISTVVEVDVIERTNDAVKFLVEHTSDVTDLVKAIKLEQSFTPFVDPRAFYQLEDSHNLKYSWVGE